MNSLQGFYNQKQPTVYYNRCNEYLPYQANNRAIVNPKAKDTMHLQSASDRWINNPLCFCNTEQIQCNNYTRLHPSPGCTNVYHIMKSDEKLRMIDLNECRFPMIKNKTCVEPECYNFRSSYERSPAVIFSTSNAQKMFNKSLRKEYEKRYIRSC